jgi:hypothetical protein
VEPRIALMTVALGLTAAAHLLAAMIGFVMAVVLMLAWRARRSRDGSWSSAVGQWQSCLLFPSGTAFATYLPAAGAVLVSLTGLLASS